MDIFISIFNKFKTREAPLWQNYVQNSANPYEISQNDNEEIYINDFTKGIVLHKHKICLSEGCLISNKQCIHLENLILETMKKQNLLGLRISTNSETFEIYIHQCDYLKWYNYIKKYAIQYDFKDHYKLLSVIGKGSFAVVYKIQNTQSIKIFAAKTLLTKQLNSLRKVKLNLFNELRILRRLSHESIIKLNEVFEDSEAIYMILDYMGGGTLQNAIDDSHVLFDQESMQLMMIRLLQGLDYMHSKNVMHRDLKPENILLKSALDISSVVISDFGLAAICNSKHNYLYQRCGTIGFVAPEVLQEQLYDCKVDLFSLGVILFTICTKVAPFNTYDADQQFKENLNSQVNYKLLENSGLSQQIKELIRSLLKMPPEMRPTAKQALKNELFEMQVIDNEYDDDEQVARKPKFIKIFFTPIIKEKLIEMYSDKTILQEDNSSPGQTQLQQNDSD